MATYKQIQDEVRNHDGLVVKSCWIAHVKELNGLETRQSPNRISPGRRAHPCPEKIRPIIVEAMKQLGMLP